MSLHRESAHFPHLHEPDDDPIEGILADDAELEELLTSPDVPEEDLLSALRRLACAMHELHRQEYTGRPEPKNPTDALPGTPDKVEEFIRRQAAKESLWHPDDATPATEDAVAIQPAEGPANGAGAWIAIDDPLKRRAAAVTGRRTGSEVALRAKMDEIRAKAREAMQELKRARREGA